jgi:hypothetical protein
MQVQMLLALSDRADFKSFSFAMIEPKLSAFFNRDAGAGRRMCTGLHFVLSGDGPVLRGISGRKCLEPPLAGLIEVVDDPTRTCYARSEFFRF